MPNARETTAFKGILTACAVLADIQDGIDRGMVTDEVIIRSKEGVALLTQADIGTAHCALIARSEATMAEAIRPLATIAEALQDGQVNLVDLGTDGDNNVLCINDDGRPLIRISDALAAQAVLASA